MACDNTQNGAKAIACTKAAELVTIHPKTLPFVVQSYQRTGSWTGGGSRTRAEPRSSSCKYTFVPPLADCSTGSHVRTSLAETDSVRPAAMVEWWFKLE